MSDLIFDSYLFDKETFERFVELRKLYFDHNNLCVALNDPVNIRGLPLWLYWGSVDSGTDFVLSLVPCIETLYGIEPVLDHSNLNSAGYLSESILHHHVFESASSPHLAIGLHPKDAADSPIELLRGGCRGGVVSSHRID